MSDSADDLIAAHGIEPEVDQPPEPDQEPEVDPRLETWQRDAARNFGLDPALAPRLVGNSQAEVSLDASRLAKQLLPVEQRHSAEALALAKKAAANSRKTERLMPSRSNPEGDFRS